MSRRMLKRFRLFVVLVTLTVLAGLLHGYLFPLGRELRYSHIAFVWLVAGTLTWLFELFFMPSRWAAPIRRMHFLAVILVKVLTLCLIIVATAMFSQGVVHGEFDPAMLVQPMMFQMAGYVFLVVLTVVVAIQVVRIVGGRVLLNFILGKYHRPVREERIFMFLDLAGSTPLAERLGDVGVQTLITRFFFDINEPIVEFGGEVHRYVGDQVVVTWPLGDGGAIEQAIRCYFAIAEKVREKAPDYEAAFGAVPGFRVGLHGGPVVASECGDHKQEIVYFGDTVNTAARIEQQCKAFDCPFLISDDLLQRTELPSDLRAESKGRIQLRGRAEEMELFAVTS